MLQFYQNIIYTNHTLPFIHRQLSKIYYSCPTFLIFYRYNQNLKYIVRWRYQWDRGGLSYKKYWKCNFVQVIVWTIFDVWEIDKLQNASDKNFIWFVQEKQVQYFNSQRSSFCGLKPKFVRIQNDDYISWSKCWDYRYGQYFIHFYVFSNKWEFYIYMMIIYLQNTFEKLHFAWLYCSYGCQW